jgi:hypothetical protein
MDLDDVVPAPDHVTRQARVIDAPPSVVWDELHRVRLGSLPVSLVLGGLPARPVLLAGKGRGGVDRTFIDVLPVPVLSSEPPSAVVFGGTRLSSETRAAATDPRTRRRFDRYWFVVGPGSSAIRWEVLTAVALRAEAHSR